MGGSLGRGVCRVGRWMVRGVCRTRDSGCGVVFGRDGPVVETDDQLDDARDIGRERGMSFVAVVFAQRRAILMQLNGEGFVDLVDSSTDHDTSSGRVGIADLQLMSLREVNYFLQFGRAGAVGGGEVLVGDVVDTGEGCVLKIVQSFHGFSFRVSAQDQRGGDRFVGVGSP